MLNRRRRTKKPTGGRRGSLQERDIDSAADVCFRTITVDSLINQVQTSLTVSALIVGVSLTLMTGGLSFDDTRATAARRDWDNAKGWQQASILFAQLTFDFSGVEFLLCIILGFLLDRSAIHPEDYDAAELWQKSFKYLLNLTKILEVCAYYSAGISTFTLCYNLLEAGTWFWSYLLFIPVLPIFTSLFFFSYRAGALRSRVIFPTSWNFCVILMAAACCHHPFSLFSLSKAIILLCPLDRSLNNTERVS